MFCNLQLDDIVTDSTFRIYNIVPLLTKKDNALYSLNHNIVVGETVHVN